MLRVAKRIILAGALGLAMVAGLGFAGDYAIFRLRVAEGWTPYGSVTVLHYDAVPQKNGKTQFIFDPPAEEICIHAIFPHAGHPPCWYLSRHTQQRTDF
jgi:hypothetical protein